MKNVWMCAVVAGLCAAVSAQEEKKSSGGQERVVFEPKAFPFEAVVSVDRVNVRQFPKTDQTSIIAAVLGLGDKVTVVGEREDFFQILPPKGATAWIHGKSVKREGASGTALGEASVRIDSRLNADVLATLKEGDAVKVVAEHMGWLKIEAPATAKYFVGRKFLRAGEAIDPSRIPAGVAIPGREGATKALDPDGEARLRIREADSLKDAQITLIDGKKLDEVDFSPVVRAYEAAAEIAKSDIVKAEAERGLRALREVQLIWATTRARLAEEKANLERKLAEALTPKPDEEKKFVMTGYIDTTGPLWKRPGTHKLLMGGRIVCFLRVKDGDEAMIRKLNWHYQEYVGINGIEIRNPDGWEGYSVIVVSEVVVLPKNQ